MNQPTHLLRSLIAGMAAAVLFAAGPARAADARPNVLVCVADDWGYPHAGAYGDPVVKTPTFDRLAREGALFNRSYCAAPSCSPSRAALLTGRWPHQLEAGANLHGFLPAKYATYVDQLERAGYAVGLQGKGWGPGRLVDRPRNPAGPNARFPDFLKTVKADQPFCFWFGGQDPHRPYEKGSGVAAGLMPERVRVPAWLPDTPDVRSDICDYLLEVQRFDQLVGEMVALLEQAGRLDNTLVVMTSDNGMPFPRGKTNLYDSGSRMPLAVRWGAKVKGGRTVDDFVSHTDLAPTILAAAGVEPEQPMVGRSFLDLLAGGGAAGEGDGTGEAAGTRDAVRDKVFVERERHANVRAGDLGYPARAVVTKQFAYVRNFRPERWPAGDPERWVAVGPFGDIDGGPAKDVVTAGKADPMVAPYFALACEKRPAEELYDLAKDPQQVRNVAADPAYAEAKQKLAADLDAWMAGTNDPRASSPQTDEFDKYPYYGKPAREDGKD